MTITPRTFLDAGPDEMADFIIYCNRRGWCSLSLAAMRKMAHEFIQRCARRGWLTLPNKNAKPEPKPEPPPRICLDRYIKHKYGFADLCVRCGARFERQRAKRTITAEDSTPLSAPGGEGRGEVANGTGNAQRIYRFTP